MDEFLTKYKEDAREKTKKSEESQKQLGEILFRFEHHFNITIIQDSMFRNHMAGDNLSALQKLYSSLESLRDLNPKLSKILEKTKIGLDSPTAHYGVDYEQGVIYISRDDSPTEYLENFLKLDASQFQNAVSARERLENKMTVEENHLQKHADRFASVISVQSLAIADETSFYTEDFQLNEDGSEKLLYNAEREKILYSNFVARLKDAQKLINRPWAKNKMKRVPIVIRSLNDGM